MFHLHSVLLIALDVVKGPYLHCCAPVNPFQCVSLETPHSSSSAELHIFNNNNNNNNNNNSFHSNNSSSCRSSSNCSTSTTSCSSTSSKISSTTTSAAADRLNGFSDIFVPRSEFSRRIMHLLEAESGLLYLFYPEEIAGLHYQRKTLRYTICFVFNVDNKLVTTSSTLAERLIQPYSVVLTSIVEELRAAEIRYGYMSRGLSRTSFNGNSQCVKREFNGELLEDSDKQLIRGEIAIDSVDTLTPTANNNNNNNKTTINPILSSSLASDEMTLNVSPLNNKNNTNNEGITVNSNSNNNNNNNNNNTAIKRVNVFLTPLQDTTALWWTPLEEMIETLYACLSGEGEETDPYNTREGDIQQIHQGPAKERIVSVRLSQMHSFHVRRMPQPNVPPCHTLDEVPIPIVDYSAEMLEWADLAVHDVFKAVDGHRNIASIIHILAAGYEPVEEESQKQLRILSPLSTPHNANSPILPSFSTISPQLRSSAPSPRIRSINGGMQTSNSALLSPIHGTEARIISPLTLEPRLGMIPPTSTFSTVTTVFTKGQNVTRICGDRIQDETITSSHEGQVYPWCTELEFIVLEALQHLEIHNYVRIVRPCRLHSTYKTTRAFDNVMCNRNHPARRIIGQRMLLVEEKFYQMNGKRLATYKEKQKYEITRGNRGNKEGNLPNPTQTVTLPAALLSTAVYEKHKKDDDVEKEGDKEENKRKIHQQIENNFMLQLPFLTQKHKCSPSSSGVASLTEEIPGEQPNSLNDRGTQVYIYNEAEIKAATGAALCALGKFTNNTIANMQQEMRRNPLWSNAFASWEEICCKALVEIALINDWLVEVL